MVTSEVSLEWTKYKALLEGYLSQGLTIMEMGKLEGVTKQSISRRLKKYGLKPNRVRKSLSKQKKVTQVTNKKKPNTPHSLTSSEQARQGVNPGTTSFLPPELQSLLSVAKDIPSWLAPTIMEHYNKKYKEEQIMTWERAKILNPKQHEIIDYLNDSNTQVVAVSGPRRTGKSTAIKEGIDENVVEGTRKTWGMWGATEHSACKILNDVWKDPITWDNSHHLVQAKTFKKLIYTNGGSIEVNPTTVTGSKGMAYQGIWLTEFDQILKNNPDAVASIVGILRSEPNLKLILDMNMGSGAYFLLIDKLQQEKYEGRVKLIELLTEDVTHLDAANDELVADLMEVAMGEDYVQEQLLHIETHTGDAFNPRLIVDAMNSYDGFMAHLGKVKYISAIGVDPGFSHPTGVSVCGTYRGHIFELEGLELKGKDVSEERIKALVAEMAHDYGACVRCESNSGGLHWIKYWDEECGLNAEAQNFGSNKLDINSRAGMMRVLRLLMEEHRIHICSDRLRQELLIYNPEKDRNDSKGDLADAFIHAVFYLYNEYLDEDDDQVVF